MSDPHEPKPETRLHRAWRRALLGTIWESGILNDLDPRFRSLYRFWLPLSNIAFMWFGYVGVLNGIESVQNATSNGFQIGWSALLGLSATGALIGISVPKLWPLELVSKTFLIGLVSLYLAIYVKRGALEPGVTATAGVLTTMIFLMLWRGIELGTIVWQRVWARRRLHKARQEAERARQEIAE